MDSTNTIPNTAYKSQERRTMEVNNLQINCESCTHYAYDEDYEYYTCHMNLDEDELYRFVMGVNLECPFYFNEDEYTIVKHQI